MNHCQCCHLNDTSYRAESNDSLNHVNNGTSYNCNSNMSGTTFQYNQDLLQTSPPISQTQWESSEYYRQEDNHHYPAPSSVYKPIVYNTPPEEMLHALLREQSDEYCYPPYKNVATGTPLSPMSMQSFDSFDTVQSPKFDDLISSPNTHISTHASSTQNSQTNSLYYVVNSSATEDTYYHQNFEQHRTTNERDQYQLQLQYEFEQQQYLIHNSMNSPQYSTLSSHQQIQQQQQNNNDRRRYHSAQHVTTNQHNNCSTNVTVSSTNSKHPFEDNDKVQPKRKRNTSRRTSPSQLICPTCSRKFTRPYNLKSHQRTHTKERPYICVRPGCTWTFARPHDLKRHDLLHSGIKKYVCSCGKPFARSDAFKRHQAVDKVCSLRLKGNYI